MRVGVLLTLFPLLHGGDEFSLVVLHWNLLSEFISLHAGWGGIVYRALGDHVFKYPFNAEIFPEEDPSQDFLSAFPHTTELQLHPDKHPIVVLASDGLWNSVKPSLVTYLVARFVAVLISLPPLTPLTKTRATRACYACECDLDSIHSTVVQVAKVWELRKFVLSSLMQPLEIARPVEGTMSVSWLVAFCGRVATRAQQRKKLPHPHQVGLNEQKKNVHHGK